MRDNGSIHSVMRRLAQMTHEERERFIGRMHSDLGHAKTAEAGSVARLPPGAPRPGSFWQEQMWFLDQLSPGAANYNAPVLLRLDGPLHIATLAKALEQITHRHDILRTTIARSAAQIIQVVAPPIGLELPYLDLSEAPDPEAALQREALALARSRLGLVTPPLYRAQLVRLNVAGTRHALIWVASHAIFDGWSVGVLLRELRALYAGQDDLSPLRLQFADFAHWQAGQVSGSRGAELLSYWEAQLAGAPCLDFPFDHPLPAIPAFTGATHEFTIAEPLAGRLIEASRAMDVTLFATFIAAYFLLLARWTGTTDLIVGTAAAGRSRPEFEPLIGPFQNVVGIRSDEARNPPFCEFARGIMQTAVEAFARQDLPFASLVERLRPARDRGRNPIWQTFFGFGSLPAAELEMELAPDLHLTCEGIPSHMVKFDFEMTIEQRNGMFLGRFDYSANLFEPATPSALCRDYQAILAAVADDFHTPVATLRGTHTRSEPVLHEEARRDAARGPRAADDDCHSGCARMDRRSGCG